MSVLISDRDGVLFDTCRANIQSYLSAAENLNLQTDLFALSRAVHDGEAFLNFYSKVWGEISDRTIQTLRIEKASFFSLNFQNVRVNTDFIESTLNHEVNPFLVTRASLESTYFLLDKFQITIFEERVISVHAGQTKPLIFSGIAKDLQLEPSQITIVDDSKDVALKSSLLGFRTIHFAHFCDY